MIFKMLTEHGQNNFSVEGMVGKQTNIKLSLYHIQAVKQKPNLNLIFGEKGKIIQFQFNRA